MAAGKLPSVDEPLTELGEIAQQALKEMRPPELEKEGLLGALRQRLGAVERRAGVGARLMAQDLVDLPGPVEQMLYRVAQEALNNALKHAVAASVTVHLRLDGERVELEISDDGRGFDTSKEPSGIGLASMRERVEKLGGTLIVRSRLGEGTSVTASVPSLRPELRPRGLPRGVNLAA